MKLRLCLAAFGLAVLGAPRAASATLSADSKITAVTVFSNGAIVTRTASIDIAAPGLIEIALENLPQKLVGDSVTVTGRGTAQATIVDVSHEMRITRFRLTERSRALEAELRQLTDQRRTLLDQKEILQAREVSLGHIEAASTAAPAKDTAHLTLEDSLKLLAFLDEQRTKIAADRRSLDTRVAELAEKITATETELKALHDPGTGFTSLTVRVNAATAGQLELTVGYAIAEASWVPTYAVRATSGSPTIGLEYFGSLRQETGEDWKDVALTLSTADPDVGSTAPTLGAWYLDAIIPPPRNTPARPSPNQTVMSGDVVALSAFSVSAAAPAATTASVAQARLETGATSASFRIETPVTIPTGNGARKIPVTAFTLSGDSTYNTTPKLLPTAYLSAKVANSSDYPILPGSALVFFDGTLVTDSQLPAVMPGETFDLALGPDEGVGIKYKRVRRFAEDRGLTGSGSRTTYEYLITIQNNKKTPVHLVVADQLPVSRYEKIVVKQLAPDPKDLKPAADGTLKWTLDLKPGEKRDLPLKFTIDHPNDLQITGLIPE